MLYEYEDSSRRCAGPEGNKGRIKCSSTTKHVSPHKQGKHQTQSDRSEVRTVSSSIVDVQEGELRDAFLKPVTYLIATNIDRQGWDTACFCSVQVALSGLS